MIPVTVHDSIMRFNHSIRISHCYSTPCRHAHVPPSCGQCSTHHFTSDGLAVHTYMTHFRLTRIHIIFITASYFGQGKVTKLDGESKEVFPRADPAIQCQEVNKSVGANMWKGKKTTWSSYVPRRCWPWRYPHPLCSTFPSPPSPLPPLILMTPRSPLPKGLTFSTNTSRAEPNTSRAKDKYECQVPCECQMQRLTFAEVQHEG